MRLFSDGFDWPARGLTLQRHKIWVWLIDKLQREVVVRDGEYRYRFHCSTMLEFARAAGMMSKEPGTVVWMNEQLKPGETFLDIGANIGIYTIMAGMRVGSEGKVSAFEPHGHNFSSLIDNIVLNGLTGVVTPSCVALGASSGMKRFYYKSIEAASSNSQIDQPYQPGKGSFQEAIAEMKWIASVDDLVEAGDLPAPDHVKVDVDGHELSILQGMERTLRLVPGPRSLSVEVYAGDAGAIQAFLDDCGYVMISENYSRKETKKMRKDPNYTPSCRNVIFHSS